MAGGKHILGKGNVKRVFGTAKVGDRGQIVIPKEARELFGIQPGDTLLILGESLYCSAIIFCSNSLIFSSTLSM